MKLALIDYGAGNLRSVRKALEKIGAQIIQTAEPDMVLSADKIVLPGVGAFRDGMQGLEESGLIRTLKTVVDNHIPLLGICLGMQLFFENSTEMGNCQGLGFIKGSVERFHPDALKIPQTGWNQLAFPNESRLFANIPEGAFVYFNHSDYCKIENPWESISETDYGLTFISAVQKGSLYGVQFHPEKSQKIGLAILKNFVELCL